MPSAVPALIAFQRALKLIGGTNESSAGGSLMNAHRANKLDKYLVTVGVLVYAVLIPVLEINASHVFNPDWPPHARLHEVWQLISNMSIGVLCLWWAWRDNDCTRAAILNCIVMGGVLVAHGIQGSYGGSLASGKLEQTLFGLQYAAVAAALVVFLSLLVLLRQRI
jgi:hypothetical protein